MEMVPTGWLAEFEVEEDADHVLIDGLEMDSRNDLTPEQFAALYNDDLLHTLGTFRDNVESSQISHERPRKNLKGSASIDSWNSDTIEQGSSPQANSSPIVACYGMLASPPNLKSSGKNKKAGKPKAKSPATVEHMLAERNRRQKLSQQFIELSSLVPGLKKIDKGSVLPACIPYIKELQKRNQELEEQISTTKTMESAVFVKKSQVLSDINSCSTEDSSSGFCNEQLPILQVKMSDRNVLIRIQCEKHRDATAHMLLETEKLNLDVISSTVFPFGSSILDITIMAQMNAESNMSINDLVKTLGTSIV